MRKSKHTTDLERELRAAAKNAETLMSNLLEAWAKARWEKANQDMRRTEVLILAYAEERINGKNAEMRELQVEAMLLADGEMRRLESAVLDAEINLKEHETTLEVARIHRSALHDLVALQVAELGAKNGKEKGNG